MANEDKKDFNAMLHDNKDMPKFQIITDQKSIEKYGGSKMYFAPPIDYDKVMKKIPYGKVITVGKIREYFAELSSADFTEPITAGIFVSIVAWASYQRSEDETPYWRTLKANGELNAKYPNNRILIASAYNAGASRVEKWLARANGKLAMDEFIASIPFFETRGYVQNVLTYDFYYQNLQNKEKLQTFSKEEYDRLY